MNICRFPNCQDQAESVVHITGIGERAVCPTHRSWMDRIGMRYVADGPMARRLAAAHPSTTAVTGPAWLRNLTARDQTGALR